MISRAKNFSSPPAALQTAWQAKKSACLHEKNNHDAKSKDYRDTVVTELFDLYKNKCAYCERNRGDELQVDHFRPKKARTRGDLKYRQPGYYWLAYEWSNLLPLCSKCNQKKSNKFPLQGWDDSNRVTSEQKNGKESTDHYNLNYLNQQESPLLLNPEEGITSFKPHFIFNEKGHIRGMSDRAMETIQICRLDRRDLNRERKKIIYYFLVSIKAALQDYRKKTGDPNRVVHLEGALWTIF